MTNENSTTIPLSGIDLSAFCQLLPTCSVLLQPNAPDYTIVAASAAFSELVGLPQPHLPGNRYWDLPFFQLNNEVETGMRPLMERLVLTKERNQFLPGSVRMQHGEEKIVTITNQPVLSTTGALLYILQTLEEKTAPSPEHLAGNNNQLHQLIEAVPAILWMTAPDGQCVYLNNPWREITGQTLEKALGYGWLNATHPDDKDEAGRLFIEASEQRKLFTAQYRLRQQDGSYRWVIDKGKPRFDSDGNYLGMIGTVLDIHDQHLAEEQSLQLSAIIEASQEFVGLAYINGAIRYINPAGLHMLGWEHVDGKSVIDCIHPADRALAQELLPLLFSQGQFSHEIRLVNTQTGEPFWLQWNAIAIRDKNSGEVIGLATISNNITERKKIEAALLQSEERVRSFVEAAPFPIGVYVGREMRIELANQSLIDVWGKGHDVIGKRYADVLPELAGQNIYEQLDQVYTTGEPFHAKYQQVDIVIDRELRSFFFSYSFTPLFDSTGKVYGVMNTAAEVTDLVLARKKVEESAAQFHRLVMQAPVAIAVFKGDDFVAEMANDFYLPLVDKTRDEFIGRPLFESLPETKAVLEPFTQELMRTGQPIQMNEFELALHRNGRLETCYFNSIWEPMCDENGKVNGFMVVAHEVTAQVIARRQIEEVVAQRTNELAQANEALVHTNQELERSNANLEEFAHAASHDLKEPIRKVLTFSDRLKHSLETRLSDTEKRLFERMENSTQRMGLLVDDLLEFSHVSQRPHEKEEVDLNEILRRVQTDLELAIEEKKATIHLAALPVVKGYKRQLQQLFQNLVSNSLKYSKTNTPAEITVTARQVKGKEVPVPLLPEQAQQAFQWIQVNDNGIGFEQQYAERIFGMFQRLHGKAEYAGTGVGLSIARKVVDNHNGYIWAEGQEDLGASFHILLPA